MNIDSILPIDPALAKPFVPPTTDYDGVSEGWSETEYRIFETWGGSFGGYWSGEPGEVVFDAWPYNEICVVTKGRVAVVDSDGRRREFGAGQGFFIPAGFTGRWQTIEAAEKFFIAIVDQEAASHGR
ncbi:MAG: cupin domain-containing protein [Rhizobiaceae bacterium]|nr:cupin domain-containing protein [Rhizobiaceae bacterium]